MSHATVKLLRAAAEILGSEEALAQHLSIGPVLLRAYLEERRPLPDYLLLRAVDVVLAQAKPAGAVPPPADGIKPSRLPTSSG
ncbi:MAG: hypothetical protein JOZ85_12780 [Betaproteobacteria bacterium]|nr:hypothetical protein [Betaproteobacteria bacterium]